MMAAYEWLVASVAWWWPRFADHLWQTTLFALASWLLLLVGKVRPDCVTTFGCSRRQSSSSPLPSLFFFAQQAGLDSLRFFHEAHRRRRTAYSLMGQLTRLSAYFSTMK